MRKLLVLVSACVMGAFFATSCCNCDKKGDKPCGDKKECRDEPRGPEGCPFQEGRGPENCPKMTPEQKEKIEKWAKFDSLTVDEQKVLLKERKAEIDAREAEKAAKKAEFEQKWADFDNLSVEEQKQLIDMKSCCGKRGPKCDRPRGPQGPEGRPCCKGPKGDGPKCPAGEPKGCPQGPAPEQK